MDPVQIALILVQIAKAYQMFEEASGDMTDEEKAALWATVNKRAVQARELWQKA